MILILLFLLSKKQNVSAETSDTFELVFSNQNANAKRFNARRYYLPKRMIKHYSVVFIGKKLWKENWFWYKTIKRN